MIDGVTGDPGSCSQLGGAFRSHAARLTALRGELAERTERLRRDPAAAATVTDLDADLRLLDTVVDRLDASGSALQRFAQELAEIAEGVRRLEGEARGGRPRAGRAPGGRAVGCADHRAGPATPSRPAGPAAPGRPAGEPARPGSGRHRTGDGRRHGGPGGRGHDVPDPFATVSP